jgi:hypothetical protein
MREQTLQALKNYVEHGTAPDAFVEAVLCNDLINAVSLADSTNYAGLKDIVLWITTQAPDACYGSAAKVNRWINTQANKGGVFQNT